LALVILALVFLPAVFLPEVFLAVVFLAGMVRLPAADGYLRSYPIPSTPHPRLNLVMRPLNSTKDAMPLEQLSAAQAGEALHLNAMSARDLSGLGPE
jgi:hypothetical protein